MRKPLVRIGDKVTVRGRGVGVFMTVKGVKPSVFYNNKYFVTFVEDHIGSLDDELEAYKTCLLL